MPWCPEDRQANGGTARIDTEPNCITSQEAVIFIATAARTSIPRACMSQPSVLWLRKFPSFLPEYVSHLNGCSYLCKNTAAAGGWVARSSRDEQCPAVDSAWCGMPSSRTVNEWKLQGKIRQATCRKGVGGWVCTRRMQVAREERKQFPVF
jgi:hypothetical protein